MDQEQFRSRLHELTDEDRAIINRFNKWHFLIASKISRVLMRKMRRSFDFLARASNATGWFPRISVGLDDLMPNADVMPNADRVMHIYYRHVHEKSNKTSQNPNKQRPTWFSHEICFRNLVDTIRLDPLAHRVKIVIVYDGTLEDFNNDFIADYYANASLGLDVQFIRDGSYLNSFMIMLSMVRSAQIPGRDLIYLLENDYLHQPGWVSKVFELYDSGHNFDYLSLYDHPYNRKLHALMKRKVNTRLVYSRSHHWRTASSSCASFILDKNTFDHDCNILRSCKADYYIFEELVGKCGRKLLVSVPGLSTHSMVDLLSPAVDWEKISAMKLSENLSKN